jgi:hypothetical protein
MLLERKYTIGAGHLPDAAASISDVIFASIKEMANGISLSTL